MDAEIGVMKMSKHGDSTADEAIRNMGASNKRMKKALTVARLAIELCEDELRRR